MGRAGGTRAARRSAARHGDHRLPDRNREERHAVTEPAITPETVVDALREVYDPCCADRGISIVDMGVVEDVRVTGARVEVDLVLTTGWCPFVASMSTAIPERLHQLDGIEHVDVRTVWEPVWTPERLSESARDKLALPLEQLIPYREQRLAQQKGA
ncbi:MAG: metal-sulfur cluster assembly factor [Solirubrobacterales bacterium]|nr:metal-sulfur cluster assembly factor [Solirubrobacterales bacterium]